MSKYRLQNEEENKSSRVQGGAILIINKSFKGFVVIGHNNDKKLNEISK